MSTRYAEHESLRGSREAEGEAVSTSAQLLLMCDFPPAHSRGGAVLLSRLLSQYQMEALTVLAGSRDVRIAPHEGRLNCRQVVFPTTNQTGRFGFGRLKGLIDWLLLPFLSIVAILLIKQSRTNVILTVAHGHFFIAATLASIATSTPLVLIVHDDWVPAVQSSSYVLKYICGPIFRFVARKAAHIYAVSPAMQEMLKREYGVDSELQMPATMARTVQPEEEKDEKQLRIVYAGTGTSAVEDSLGLLIDLVRSNLLESHQISDWELHLYTPTDLRHPTQQLWKHDRIRPHGWVDQETLQAVLMRADILFLPFSFRQEERYATERAFPAKTADYLASGRPILVLAPAYSSIAQYFRKLGCGAIVDQPNLELLAEEISSIWKSATRRQELKTNSLKAFELNHNIESQRLAFNELLSTLAAQRDRKVH